MAESHEYVTVIITGYVDQYIWKLRVSVLVLPVDIHPFYKAIRFRELERRAFSSK